MWTTGEERGRFGINSNGKRNDALLCVEIGGVDSSEDLVEDVLINGECPTQYQETEDFLVEVFGGEMRRHCRYPPMKEMCDTEHLELCLEETDCVEAGGYWHAGECSGYEEGAECDEEHLGLCFTKGTCVEAGGYWYDDVCNGEDGGRGASVYKAVDGDDGSVEDSGGSGEDSLFGEPKKQKPFGCGGQEEDECSMDEDCYNYQMCCEGKCVSRSDKDNCGECGNVCEEDEVCYMGECTKICSKHSDCERGVCNLDLGVCVGGEDVCGNGVCSDAEGYEDSCWIDCDTHCNNAVELAQKSKDDKISRLDEKCRQQAEGFSLACGLAWEMLPDSCQICSIGYSDGRRLDPPYERTLNIMDSNGNLRSPDDMAMEVGLLEGSVDVFCTGFGGEAMTIDDLKDVDSSYYEIVFPFDPSELLYCWGDCCIDDSQCGEGERCELVGTDVSGDIAICK